MTPLALRADDVAPTAWRNGGGRTRELFAWPPGADWKLRVSLADIDADGPFSAFPGVRRWFAVLSGAGVVLHFADGDRRLDTGTGPLAFDGAAAPGCSLVAGPTRDLNLMLRGGATGRMERAASGVAWQAGDPWRACFAAGRARWHGGAGIAPVALEANTLLLHLSAGPCRLETEGPEPAFWLAADGVEEA